MLLENVYLKKTSRLTPNIIDYILYDPLPKINTCEAEFGVADAIEVRMRERKGGVGAKGKKENGEGNWNEISGNELYF